jgi:hypothetical protein
MSSGVDPERDEAGMWRQITALRTQRMAEQMRALQTMLGRAVMAACDFEAAVRRMAEAMNSGSRAADSLANLSMTSTMPARSQSSRTR